MFSRFVSGLRPAAAFPHSFAAGLQAGLPTQPVRFKVVKRTKRRKNKIKKFPRIAVILREDVHKLGVAGEEVLVKRGHARNNLLLKQKKEHAAAVYSTPENRRLYQTVFPIEEGKSASNEAITDALETDILLNLSNRSVPFYALPDPNDRTQTEKPITLAQIHNALMSNGGLSWLFLEQLTLLSVTNEINKFGKYRIEVDLGAGPLPVGTSKQELVIDVRLREPRGISSRKLAEQEKNKANEATPLSAVEQEALEAEAAEQAQAAAEENKE